jgi:tol-pal system protein YbgF
MSLKNSGGLNFYFRHMWFIYVSIAAFLLIGCGGSEETAKEESNPPGTVDQQKEAKPMDQALTNFIGTDTEKVVEAPKPDTIPSAQLLQYEKHIEDLRAENTGLKQKIVKLEQENRDINARVSDNDAKIAAEKLRADKAEETAKNAGQSPTDENPIAVSASTYDNALRSFRSHRYDAAAKEFKAIIDGGSGAELTGRAKYWLGETYFAQRKYNQALPLFQESLKQKNSEKKADAQFMIAQSYDHLGSKAKAKAAYEKVVKNYPMSKNVKRAKARWAKL